MNGLAYTPVGGQTVLLGLEYSQTQGPTVKKPVKVEHKEHKSTLLGGGSWLSAIGTGWRQLSLMEASQVQAGWLCLRKGLALLVA